MGISLELVITPDNSEKLKNFMCSICIELVENPVMIKLCEHIFCQECLNSWSANNNCCPDCRIAYTETDVGKSRFLDNLISEFVMLQCYNENCPETFSPLLFKSHLENCDFREFICRFCSEKLIFAKSKSHLVS